MGMNPSRLTGAIPVGHGLLHSTPPRDFRAEADPVPDHHAVTLNCAMATAAAVVRRAAPKEPAPWWWSWEAMRGLARPHARPREQEP